MSTPLVNTISTITDEKTMSTTTDEKSAIVSVTQIDKLPAPAVASPTRNRLQRARLPPRWEASLFVQFAVAKVTTPTLHFWTFTVAITFIIATIMAIQKQPGEKRSIWRAAINVWWVRYRREEDNFWIILLSRMYSTYDVRWWWQMICFLILVPWVGCVRWWPEVVGEEVFGHTWVKVLYQIGKL